MHSSKAHTNAETVRFIRDPDLEGLEVRLVRASKQAFPKHCHDYYTIGLMERGGSFCFAPGDEQGLVKAGDLALFNPGQVHTGMPWIKGRAITYRMFHVDGTLMERVAEDLHGRKMGRPEFTRTVAHNPALPKIFYRLSMLAGQNRDRLEKESVLTQALAGLLKHFGEHASEPGPDQDQHRAVRIALQYLNDQPDQKITLDDLAKEAGLSRFHLLRVFKNATGLPPHVHLTLRRLERARLLLLRGMPIAQAALEAGFADQSHFTNKFKQFVGATPGQYLAV